MIYDVRIVCDNDAFFEDDPSMELSRILKELSNKIRLVGIENRDLYDSNGNKVGHAHYSKIGDL